MRVQPAYGETLPALLQRRRGIAPRTTLAVVAALIVLAVLAFLLQHDPFGGMKQVVHHGNPVFNMLYPPGEAHPAPRRPGELERIEAHRGPLGIAVTVHRLRLPAYRGDVGGELPVYVVGREAALRRSLPRFRVTDEGRARLHGAPAYEVAFSFGTRAHPSFGRDMYVLPKDAPGIRDGVVVSLRLRHGRHALTLAGQTLSADMRGVLRSFRFGTALTP